MSEDKYAGLKVTHLDVVVDCRHWFGVLYVGSVNTPLSGISYEKFAWRYLSEERGSQNAPLC